MKTRETVNKSPHTPSNPIKLEENQNIKKDLEILDDNHINIEEETKNNIYPSNEIQNLSKIFEETKSSRGD